MHLEAEIVELQRTFQWKWTQQNVYDLIHNSYVGNINHTSKHVHEHTILFTISFMASTSNLMQTSFWCHFDLYHIVLENVELLIIRCEANPCHHDTKYSNNLIIHKFGPIHHSSVCIMSLQLIVGLCCSPCNARLKHYMTMILAYNVVGCLDTISIAS